MRSISSCFKFVGLDHRLVQTGQTDREDLTVSESFQPDAKQDGQGQPSGGRNDDQGRFVPPKGVPGFTLIELAIMLSVFGLVLVGGIEAIRVQTAKRKIDQTQTAMQEIQHAFLGFITVNGRLPYPARPSNANGVEDNTLAVVDSAVIGLLPWSTLGIKPVDSWGHAYTYHVTEDYAVEASFSGASGALTVRDASDTDMATGLPFVMVSHGPKGRGAYMTSGSQLDTTGASVMELENTDADTLYRMGSDDVLKWTSSDILKYQKNRSYSP